MLKNSAYMVRQAHHERGKVIISIKTPFILSLSKDQEGLFQQVSSQ